MRGHTTALAAVPSSSSESRDRSLVRARTFFVSFPSRSRLHLYTMAIFQFEQLSTIDSRAIDRVDSEYWCSKLRARSLNGCERVNEKKGPPKIGAESGTDARSIQHGAETRC